MFPYFFFHLHPFIFTDIIICHFDNSVSYSFCNSLQIALVSLNYLTQYPEGFSLISKPCPFSICLHFHIIFSVADSLFCFLNFNRLIKRRRKRKRKEKCYLNCGGCLVHPLVRSQNNEFYRLYVKKRYFY